MFFSRKKAEPVDAAQTLAGREAAIDTAETHSITGNRLKPPFPDGFERAIFGMGCFWGAERCFWQLPDIWVTAVGYGAGDTPNPTYEEVCSGRTNHNEILLVVYDPDKTSYQTLLTTFWENHNPTQGMRQGNDMGTQYRSGIYPTSPAQADEAGKSLTTYQAALSDGNIGQITTEIRDIAEFYYAEDYHQQYLAKNPQGYCGLGGTGVRCPAGL